MIAFESARLMPNSPQTKSPLQSLSGLQEAFDSRLVYSVTVCLTLVVRPYEKWTSKCPACFLATTCVAAGVNRETTSRMKSSTVILHPALSFVKGLFYHPIFMEA